MLNLAILKLKFPLFVISFFLILHTVKGQDEFINFTNISIDKGLSVSAVFEIIQDKNGYLWLATQDGLNKYDGKTFKIYRQDDTKNSISHNNLNSVTVDQDGNIWTGNSVNGLDKFNPTKEHFTNYKNNPEDSLNSLNSNWVLKVFTDAFGNVWVATTRGLAKYQKETNNFKRYFNRIVIRNYFIDSENKLWIGGNNGLHLYDYSNDTFQTITTKDGLSNNVVLSITEDKTARLWISTAGNNNGNQSGINIYDRQNKNFYHFENSPELFKNFPKELIFNMISDDKQNIWFVSGSNGLYLYNYIDKSFKNFKHDDLNKNSLPNDNIRNIYQDRSGLYWISTFGAGISKCRYSEENHFRTVKNDPKNPNSLISNFIFSIYEDKEGGVWYGSYDKGISHYQPKTKTFTNYPNLTFDTKNPIKHLSKGRSVSGPTVYSFFEDSYDNFWIGTNNGLNLFDKRSGNFTFYIRDDKSNLPSNNITAFFEDKDRDLWVGTGGGLCLLDRKTNSFSVFRPVPGDSNSLASTSVVSIAQDADGFLWIGGGAGLTKFDKNKKQFKRYYKNASDLNSLSDNSIMSIVIDKENRVWIGTNNGLSLYNKETDKFTRFGVANGFANQLIYGALVDDDNQLWMSTNFGLVKFNYNQNTVVNYDERDGLQSNEFNQYAYHKSRLGKMYFGGVQGVSEFNPNKILMNMTEPLIAINSTRVNYELFYNKDSINDIRQLELTYKQNTLSFEIAVLEFTIPEKNTIEYLLEGFNSNWVKAGREGLINFTNLAANDYILKIRATNNDGVVSSQSFEIPFTVLPPFWQTWWFITLSILFIIGSALAAYLIKMNNVRKQRELLEFQVNERTKELKEKTDEVLQINENLAEEIDLRRETEVQLLTARNQTDTILKNVREGIFLLMPDRTISEQHSIELESIFEQNNISYKNILDLTRPLVTSKTHDALKDYIDLLFMNDVDEDIVNELNPLDLVEVHFEEKAGKFKIKHLEFNFKRVYADKTIINLLVTVHDVTENVILQAKLKDAEKRNKQEMEHMLSILRVEPNSLKRFLNEVNTHLKEVSKLLKTDHEDYYEVLNRIFRIIHSLKGNAGMLNINFFVERFHEIETIISNLKDKDEMDLSGDDFLPILFEINEVNENLSSMNRLIDRVLRMSKSMSNNESPIDDFNSIIFNIEQTVERLSRQFNKKVNFVFENKNNYSIPENLIEPFKNIVIQLIRNSMVHGIESEEDRRNQNKKAEAEIKLSLDEVNGSVKFSYKDDGQGLNLDKIKEKALSLGKMDKTKVDSMGPTEIAKLIFNDGLSTSEETTEHAGRGEGMSIIREIIAKTRGKMKFSFAKGKFFEMGFEFPQNQTNAR